MMEPRWQEWPDKVLKLRSTELRSHTGSYGDRNNISPFLRICGTTPDIIVVSTVVDIGRSNTERSEI